MNHLLYADDKCITAHTPAACQHLLDVVQQWFDCRTWANLKAKPSKSRVLCIKASTGRVCMSPLSIGGEVIQHVGDSSFQFLGMHIRVPPNPAAARDALKQSVVSMLKAINGVLVTLHQKLQLYRQGMCPRLMWTFLVEVFPISFFRNVIQPLATHFLKKWSGLARSANPSLLFLSHRQGGLGLPILTPLYKKQQASLQVYSFSPHRIIQCMMWHSISSRARDV